MAPCEISSYHGVLAPLLAHLVWDAAVLFGGLAPR
jgi:hypothetical protein